MSDEQFKLFDDLLAAVVAIDSKGKVAYFNQAFLVVTQSSPRAVKNLEHFSKLFKSGQKALNEIIEKAQKGEVVVSQELNLTTTQGHGPLTVVCKAIPHASYVLVTMNDLTVERTLYHKYRIQLEEIKKTHEKILATDKLATLGELSAGISHEINNPLTVAYGYAQNIEWMLEQDEFRPYKELILSAQRVTSSLEKISSIVNNMKSYVRADDDLQEFCDIKDVVTAACELTHTGLTKEKVKLEICSGSEPLLIQANRIELEQVIVNVLKNSFDALLDSQQSSPKVIVTLAKRDHGIVVTVADNGPGVEKDLAKKIFQPFFTTKEIGRGSGLGLAISQRLIEKHRGSLSLKDTTKGACFEIKLPTMEMSSMLASGGFGPHIGQNENAKILIVDDNPEILNLLDHLLRQNGYSVIGSMGGEEAINLLIQTEVDLVITDLLMPKLSGSDLAKHINEIEPDLPILYLSGAKDAQKIFENDSKSLKIAGLIGKPFKDQEILAAIAKALGAAP